ncbi:hypothetical protein D3C85_462040 [compost metagenome]
MRSIRSAGLAGRRAEVARTSSAGVPRSSDEAAASSRAAKASRTVPSSGCTDSSTRSNTAKPTGRVSMRRSTGGPPRDGRWGGEGSALSWPLPVARRRNTSTSYSEV